MSHEKSQASVKNGGTKYSMLNVTVGKLYLTMLQWKHSLGNKTAVVDEEKKFADRVCRDPYSPFVKSAFRKTCNLWRIEEGPMGVLRRSVSMAEVFREAVQMYRDEPCMGYRPILETREVSQENGKLMRKIKQGGYRFISYGNVDELVESYGRGIRSLGVQPGQNVVILAETCFEWMCIAQALMRFNIPIVTVYATLSEEGIIHGINETQASMLITSQDMLEKMRESFSAIDHLKNIVYFERSDKRSPRDIPDKSLISLFQLKNIGEHVAAGVYPYRRPDPRDTAIIMYTSGSTGTPKGVILSHRNMIAAAKGLSEVFEAIKVTCNDAYVAYLPLAHVFEMNCEMIALLYGVKIGYSSAQTLTDSGTLLDKDERGDCAILMPTIMASVPMVLDRVKKAILQKVKAKGTTATCTMDMAIGRLKDRWLKGQDTSIYDPLLAKLKAAVGGRVRLIATGSAPLSEDTHAFIRAALGCAVVQGYGLTETCAAATCMEIGDVSTGEVGCPVSGAYIKLKDWEEGGYFVKENRGELILGGDMISEGYYKNPGLTEESFFEEGGVRYFKTGDIGEVTSRGTFKIIDRKKDLVKLQHGEYVSLGKIEAELKTLGIVENICVYGDSLQSTVVALIQPNRQQLEILRDELDKKHLSTEQLFENSLIIKTVLAQITAHCQAKKFNRVEIPVRVKLCKEEWTPETELVTAAFKLRRAQIYHKYKDDLAKLYN